MNSIAQNTMAIFLSIVSGNVFRGNRHVKSFSICMQDHPFTGRFRPGTRNRRRLAGGPLPLQGARIVRLGEKMLLHVRIAAAPNYIVQEVVMDVDKYPENDEIQRIAGNLVIERHDRAYEHGRAVETDIA